MHSTYLVVFIFFLITQSCTQIYYMKLNITENERIRTSLSMCIIKTCRRYFNSSFETITYSLPLVEVSKNVVSATLLSELVLPTLGSEQHWAFVMEDLKQSHQVMESYTEKSFSYIIQIRREGELKENIKKLKEFVRWNPHAKFLVVSPTVFAHPHKVAVDVIKSFWYYNVINAVVLLVDNSNYTNFNVYSWRPYSRHSCGNNFSDTFAVDNCSFGVTGSNTDWFDNKIPKQVYKCPVKVKYMVWPPFVMGVKLIAQVSNYDADLGIDINLLNMIANTINLSLIYEKSAYNTWGDVDEHYSATKDLKLLKENKIDLVTGGYVKTPQRITLFDSSQTHVRESLVLCVPHEPIITGFNNFLTVLETEVWVVVCILYFIVSICLWCASNRHEYYSYNNVFNCLLNNYSVLIGLAVHKLPRTVRSRYFMSLFIIFSLKLNMIYNSYLTSVLSSPSYREKYGSMEEIYKLNLKTYFLSSSKMFFEDTDRKEINNVPLSVIKERWRDCTNLTQCFNSIASERDLAVCMPRFYKDYLVNGQAREKRREIFCLKDNVVSFPESILMRKGFPLLNLFDKTISKIIEAGFIDKWTRDILMNKSEGVGNNSEEKVRIDFNTLAPVFYMLVAGYISASLAFVLESLAHNLQLFT